MFFFKHHYITQAMDSDAAAPLFDAMRRHAYVTFDNLSRYSNTASAVRAVPLRIYISAQGGRQHLLAFSVTSNRIRSYRLDYISNVRAEADICENFTELFDTTEMLPWIRTFISRITRLDFSNRTAENKFREDLREMYRMYGIDGGENVDIQ